MQLLPKTADRFLTYLKVDLPDDSAISSLGAYPNISYRNEICIDIRGSYLHSMLIAVQFIVASTWNQSKCPYTGDWIEKM